jgi:hypothetical protein
MVHRCPVLSNTVKAFKLTIVNKNNKLCMVFNSCQYMPLYLFIVVGTLRSMEQIERSQQTRTSTGSPVDFRDLVDAAIAFGCIPALVLNIILWAVTTTFPYAGALPSILTLLVTLLLALIGIILLVRYVDICELNVRMYNAPSVSNSDEYFILTGGSGIICGFLAISLVVCLSMAGTLEGWHYTLMAVEVLLAGYQTWRTFLGRRAQ